MNDIDNDDNSIIVEVSNPYSDTIILKNEYYIYQKNPDTLLLRGFHPEIILEPLATISLKVTLGLDSIWYHKDKTYLFVFPGESKDKDIVYYGTDLRLGYFNRLNGEMVLLPDTIVFCHLFYEQAINGGNHTLQQHTTI